MKLLNNFLSSLKFTEHEHPEDVLCKKLMASGFDKYIIYGAGELGKKIFQKMTSCEQEYELVGWIDVSVYENDKLAVNGMQIKPIHELASTSGDVGVILATQSSVRDMRYYCSKFGVEEHRIFSL